MGCDIHLYCEKQIDIDGKKIWWCADRFMLNEYYLTDKTEPKLLVDHIYGDRDYTLFAVLAGIRDNGTTEMIDEPRGLPKDVSAIIKKESDDWGVDGHSHSWLTAKELFDYQKKHLTTKYRGMVHGDALEKLDKYGIAPDEWCGWTNIKGAEMREWTVQRSPVDRLVECVKKRMADEFWIFDFLSEREREAKFMENADKFRIVFWFDN